MPPTAAAAGDHQASSCATAGRNLLPPSVLSPEILGCPEVALPLSSLGLVVLPHLGTAHMSPFPCYCSLPGCLTLAVNLSRGQSGWTGLSPGAGSESLPVSHSQPGFPRCFPGWLGPLLGLQ